MQPSPGALRAAERIIDTMNADYRAMGVDEVAAIIEEETGVAELLAALVDLYGDMPDMVQMTDIGAKSYECRHCGRVYDISELPKDASECSDDCPGHIARAAIARATGKG